MREPEVPARAEAFVRSLGARLGALAGWRGRAAGFLAGAVATLALPPAGILPALYLTIPVLLWMLAGRTSRKAAFGLGWWFGFGYFSVGLYWIGNAMLVFSSKHAWLIPFAALGLPAFLAIFTGCATLVASIARHPLSRALLFIVAWCGLEWLRGHVLTGFPWNLIGSAWAGSDALLQSTALIGIYGVSLVALLSACLLAVALDTPARARIGLALVSLMVVAGPWIGGQMRLSGAPATGTAMVEGVGLRLVQAGIPQREKWRREFRNRNLLRHHELSIENRPDWISHIIWPENAATFFLADDTPRRFALAQAVPSGGLLITGAPRRAVGPLRIWNSAFAVNDQGTVVAQYDKFHLVPFGEYAPFRDFLPVDKIAHGMTDYSAGSGPKTLHLPGLPPVSPLICYEVIFPGAVLDPADRPAWLLNLTNDAWYGKTAGPHQHLAISRVRAVEEGLPVVRAANTGISAVIDPYGRVLGSLPLDTAGVLDSRLPKPVQGLTVYGRFGDLPFLVLMLALLAGCFFAGRSPLSRL